MHVYRLLIESDAPEDPDFGTELRNYFPRQLHERTASVMGEHPLAREIVATQVTNEIVNRMGPTFVHAVMEDAGADVGAVARAWTTATISLAMPSRWAAIEALDNQVDATVQYSLLLATAGVLRQSTLWFLDHAPRRSHIGELLGRYRDGVQAVRAALPAALGERERARFDQARRDYAQLDVPPAVADEMAALTQLPCAFDIVDIAREYDMETGAAAALYFRVGGLAGADWLREELEQLAVTGRWHAIARQSLRDTAYELQADLVRHVAGDCGGAAMPCDAAIEDWAARRGAALTRVQRIIGEIRDGGGADFESLTVVANEIGKLARPPNGTDPA
jgi:glutamate dehydrogenase